METGNGSLSVGEVAGLDYRKAEVFRRYGIDFCCGGGQTLAEAASRAGISEGELRSALEAAEMMPASGGYDFANRTPDELIDHIMNKHHKYIREVLPVLWEYARKVAGHHGDAHPELVKLDMLVRSEAQDLLAHLEREESVLFPAIKRLAPAQGTCSVGGPSANNVDFVERAVKGMVQEHSDSGDNLEAIKLLTNNYTPPAEACNSYRFLFEKLKEFDLDLREHIHLENNVLFPRALALLKGER